MGETVSYFARDGKVYARLPGGGEEEAATALSADGRDLERHDRALQVARAQREHNSRIATADRNPLALLREIHEMLGELAIPLFDSRSRKQDDRADLGRRLNAERTRLLTAIGTLEREAASR